MKLLLKIILKPYPITSYFLLVWYSLSIYTYSYLVKVSSASVFNFLTKLLSKEASSSVLILLSY